MAGDNNLESPEYLNWESTDEEVKKSQDKVMAARTKRATAYHDVFAKTEAGNKILTEWIQNYCTSRPAGRNGTDREVHMNDGKRDLISEILEQIKVGENL